jgi:TonB family protein
VKDIQSHIIAGVTTVVILLLLLLLLFKLTISAPIQMEDEGIVITFGYSDEGGGAPDALPLMPMAQSEVQPAAPAPLPQLPSDNELIVQEDEESLALAEQNEEEQKRKALEQELIRKQREAEAAQAEAERIARERALAEQRAKEQEAIDKANQLAALFGQSNSTEGANADDASIEPSPSGKGNPVGKNFGIVDGNMWSLQGRKVKSMPKPSSDFNQQGKVVVNIRVDKEGNVVLASIGDGTNISDSYTQQLALEAARKAKFTAGEREQVGSITYNFKLN